MLDIQYMTRAAFMALKAKTASCETITTCFNKPLHHRLLAIVTISGQRAHTAAPTTEVIYKISIHTVNLPPFPARSLTFNTMANGVSTAIMSEKENV